MCCMQMDFLSDSILKPENRLSPSAQLGVICTKFTTFLYKKFVALLFKDNFYQQKNQHKLSLQPSGQEK